MTGIGQPERKRGPPVIFIELVQKVEQLAADIAWLCDYLLDPDLEAGDNREVLEEMRNDHTPPIGSPPSERSPRPASPA